MGSRALENRIRKLRNIEAQQKELEQQAEAIKAEIKKEMEAQGTEELHTGNFIIRWKDIISNRLDSKALKATFPDIYSQFMKETASKRFTIA